VGRPWLARHGETEWTVSRRHTGSTDIPLTPAGEEQARALGEKLHAAGAGGFALVLTSPMGRARRTAELAGFSGVEVEPLLHEVDYGDYEGLTTAEIHETRPGWDLWSDGSPGGETPEQVVARADRVLERVRDAGGDALLFGHAHFSRALGARWLERPIGLAGQLMLGTASLSVMGTEHGRPALERWNL
jgi:probable phosphoglycerate mutase